MAELVYPPVIRAALLSFKALGMTVDVTGHENVPADGGAVIASNHVSYLDFLFAGLPPWQARRRLTRFMAKEAVFRHKIAGPLMRGMHHIPVDRDAGTASFRTALKALKDGELVGVFPEATISRSFTVKELKSGTVRMAAAARVPIVPTAVWGGHRLFTKGHPKAFDRGRTVMIAVGEPFPVSTRDDPGEAVQQLRSRLQLLLDDVQARHPDTAVPDPQAWWLPAHLGGAAPTPEEARAMDAAERPRHQDDA
jgi:1-acyl-sn-glycerol-3-phosphate acyltransferase